MPRCAIHPAHESVFTVNNRNYCVNCQAQIHAARSRVDRHVQPSVCFVWYTGGAQGWQPIPGTGCAHWVAHQRNITGGDGGTACLEGFPIRVPTIVRGRLETAVGQVRVNDIWVNIAQDHTGLVVRVSPGAPGQPPQITIRHDSSRQGGVFENDFRTYFHGQGKFFR